MGAVDEILTREAVDQDQLANQVAAQTCGHYLWVVELGGDQEFKVMLKELKTILGCKRPCLKKQLDNHIKMLSLWRYRISPVSD